MARKLTDTERVAAFWAKVDRSGGPDTCWPWLGFVNPGGYGWVWWRDRSIQAHRVSWFLAHGSWPAPKTPLVLHRPTVCHNRACVNPLHLYLGTARDNSRDMKDDRTVWQLARTHCPKGHPYDESNTIVERTGKRKCRECARIYRAAHYAAHREELRALAKERYAENLEENRARSRERGRVYYATHRDDRVAAQRARRARGREERTCSA